MNGDADSPVVNRSPEKTSIQWEDVHRRIADMGRQLAETGHRSPEQDRTLLKDRARALALPEKSLPGNEKLIRVVEFDLAGEHYAIEHSYVREVIPLREFTPIPGTPPFILGVIALRGRVVSLMDLRIFLGLPATGLVNGARAVVLADDHMEFAILADRVIGLCTLRVDLLQPTVTTLIGIGADYLLGVTPDGLVVFDGKAILTDPQMIVRGREG
jgi:purine-binding chemotaxis protein CheW